MRMLRPVVYATLLALAAPLTASAAGNGVGYIDLQKALLSTKEGKAAKAKLQKEHKKRQARLDAEQAELLRMKQDLEKKAAVMDPKVLEEKGAEFQQKLMELNMTYQTLQKELFDEEQKIRDRMFQKMRPILEKIATENGLSIIVERAQVLWADESLDFTNELIRRYNKAGGAPAPKK